MNNCKSKVSALGALCALLVLGLLSSDGVLQWEVPGDFQH